MQQMQMTLSRWVVACSFQVCFGLSVAYMITGGGVVVASVERCAGVKAEVIGKPSRTMLSILEEQYGVNFFKH